MAFKITNSRVQDSELLYNSALEQAVEGEYTIPDYKPEIQKILKCVPTPVVIQKLAVGAKATVEGYIFTTVLYLTSDSDAVYSLQYKLPFSRQIDLKRPVDDGAWISANMSVQYFNCRVVSRRKVDCRGSFNLFVAVQSYGEAETISGIEGDGAQQRTFEAGYKRISAHCERQFTIEEQLQIEPQGAAEVLRHSAYISDLRSSAAGAQLTAEGVLNIRISVSYPDAAEIKNYDYRLPFSQDIDADLDFETAYQSAAHGQVISAELNPSAEDDSLIDASFTCIISAAVAEEQTAKLVADVYSTEYECAMETRRLSLLSELAQIEKPFSASFEFAQQIAGGRVVDVVACPQRITAKEDGSIAASIEVSCFVIDRDGDFVTLSQEVEAAVFPEMPGANYMQLSAAIDTESCVAEGAVICAKIAGRISGTAAVYRSYGAVVSAQADEKNRKQKNDVALSIYYAEDGEDVWDIAKRYNTAAGEIMEHNSLESQVLSGRRMLLIPIVK